MIRLECILIIIGISDLVSARVSLVNSRKVVRNDLTTFWLTVTVCQMLDM